MREIPLPAPADDPGVLEQVEVLRDVLLCRSDERRQLEHRGLAVAEPVEQLDPGRLAERTEALGDQVDQVIRERVRDCTPAHAAVGFASR